MKPLVGQDLPRSDQLALTAGDTDLECLAARAVRRCARNADDEHELLDALGLLPTPPTTDRPINTVIRKEATP